MYSGVWSLLIFRIEHVIWVIFGTRVAWSDVNFSFSVIMGEETL